MVEPKPVDEIKFTKVSFGKKDTYSSCFDPRSLIDRLQDRGNCTLFKSLKEYGSDCVLFHLWDMETFPVTPRKVPIVEMELMELGVASACCFHKATLVFGKALAVIGPPHHSIHW